MIQMINKLKKNQKGFTLVELIVVLVILAILAAFTIPAMLGFVNDARNKAHIAEARECYVAAQSVATEMLASTNTEAKRNSIISGINSYVKGTTPSLSGDALTAYTNFTASVDNDITTGATVTGVEVDANGKVTKLVFTIPNSVQITINNGESTVVTL